MLSGGPASVYAAGAPRIDPGLFELGVPTLGICYGMQLMAQDLGGAVERTGVSEFGKTEVRAEPESELFKGLPEEQTGWMSHRDSVAAPPEGARVTAGSPTAPIAAFEDPERGLYGVQFHPEVVHTPHGMELLKNFLYGVADAPPTWTAAAVIEEQVERIRAQVGTERVLCALSGGVDSAVAALLVHKAVGDQLVCVFVDHGLMRKDEAAQVVETFEGHFHVPLVHVDAQERFLSRLDGVTDPEEKRKAIGEEFIRVFEEESRRLGEVRLLVQGTLYSDVIESGGEAWSRRRSSRITTSAGCPRTWRWSSSSRCARCSRTRCGGWARSSGCPSGWSGASRSRGRGSRSGSSARSPRERLEILREADAILQEEMRRAGPVPRALAVVRGAPGDPLGRRAGRRADVRLPDRRPRGHERRRDDGRLGAAALRPAGDDLVTDRQRGARR